MIVGLILIPLLMALLWYLLADHTRLNRDSSAFSLKIKKVTRESGQITYVGIVIEMVKVLGFLPAWKTYHVYEYGITNGSLWLTKFEFTTAEEIEKIFVKGVEKEIRLRAAIRIVKVENFK